MITSKKGLYSIERREMEFLTGKVLVKYLGAGSIIKTIKHRIPKGYAY